MQIKFKKYLLDYVNFNHNLDLIFNKIIYLINKLKKRLVKNYTFDKKFNTFKEFLNFKNSHKINQTELDKNLKKRLKINHKFEIINRFYVMPIFASCMQKKKINILEFGGSNNPIQEYIKKTTKKKISSTVIETKNFVENVNTIKIPDKIKYLYSLKNINLKKFDICYFGSSIQYLPDCYELLTNLFSHKIKNIIITDTFFNKTNYDYFVLHDKEDRLLFPNRFFSYAKFINLFKKNAYVLQFKNKKDSRIYTHRTINNSEYFLCDLIFTKNK
jgi:putative methyltransferase (TIGR04325 family)